MPGEHWCSICEKDISKHKGKYVKLYFFNFDKEKKRIVNIVCPDCRENDKDLDSALAYLEEKARPVETLKGDRKCSFCANRITKSEKSLRAEFRYNGSELRTEVCETSLLYPILEPLQPKKQNPVFKVDILCHSTSICGSFKKPRKDRGINCGHICVNIEGELYCRKAHPGSIKVYRERWALPPSRRQLMDMLKDMQPIFKQMSEQAKLVLDKREEFYNEIENIESQTLTLRQIPDEFKYEIIEFPIEDNQIIVPWNASVIKLNLTKIIGEKQTAIVLVPKK